MQGHRHVLESHHASTPQAHQSQKRSRDERVPKGAESFHRGSYCRQHLLLLLLLLLLTEEIHLIQRYEAERGQGLDFEREEESS
jgi:hypothetical protein